MNPDVLTTAQLAEEWQLPEGTLANWRWLGKGPAYFRAGRHVRYRRADCEAWMVAQVRGG